MAFFRRCFLVFLVAISSAVARRAVRGASNVTVSKTNDPDGCVPSDGLTVCQCCNFRNVAWNVGACHDSAGAPTPCHQCCAAPVPTFTPELHLVNVEGINDWGTADCPSGYQIVGGGCESVGGHQTQYNGPLGDSKWQCGGHGTQKNAWAVCAKLKDSVVVEQATVGDWGSHTCSNNYIAVGGGCNAVDPPHKFQVSWPADDHSWGCGGHGGGKEVHVICASPASVEGLQMVHSSDPASAADWMTIDCPSGSSVIGGGCKNTEAPHTFAKNWPANWAQYECGGNGGKKELWAMCLNGAQTMN